MIHLALQTVERPEGFAILDKTNLLSEVLLTKEQSISDDLAGLVEAELDMVSLEFKDLEFITVVVGPGSFTGIKSGLAYAKGLAVGLDIPLVSVNSLETLAFGLEDEVVAMIDARNQRAYYQSFNTEKFTHPSVGLIEDILKDRKGKVQLIGSGATGNAEMIKLIGNFGIIDREISSNKAGLLGLIKYNKGERLNAEEIKTLHVSGPNVTLSAKNYG